MKKRVDITNKKYFYLGFFLAVLLLFSFFMFLIFDEKESLKFGKDKKDTFGEIGSKILYSPSNSIYLDGYTADTEFAGISDSCLATIRQKKMLFSSRSYGQNILGGINRYKADNIKYNLSSKQYDTNNGVVIPDDAFVGRNIVHSLMTLWPRSASVNEFNNFVRNQFFNDMNIGLLEFQPLIDVQNYKNDYDYYSYILDKLREDYQDMRFIYYTSLPAAYASGVVDPINANATANLRAYILQNYSGKVLIFDYYDFVSTRNQSPSTGGTCVKTGFDTFNYADCACTFTSGGVTYRRVCPEYIANEHPSTEVIERRFGRGLFVMFSKLYCPQSCTSDVQCDNGLFCDGVETCQAGTCASGISPCANDGYSCTTECSEQNMACNRVYRNDLCNDKNGCIDDICVSSGGNNCVNTIDDTNTCSVIGQCADNVVCSSGQCIASANIDLCPNPISCGQVACNSQSYLCEYSSCPIADSSLRLWLRVNGDLVDYSGYGNSALPYGITYVADRLGSQTGALYFDGQDYVDLGTGTFNINSTQEFSISAWVNSSSSNIFYQTIFSRGRNLLPFWLQIAGNRVRAAVKATSGLDYIYSIATLQKNKWYHVVLTYKNNQANLYVDGVFDNSMVMPSGSLVMTANERMTVGTIDGLTAPFIGEIDDVRLYDKALNSSDILTIYNENYLFVPFCTDNDSDGANLTGGNCGVADCNDRNFTIKPGIAEPLICDNLDQNCNGLADEPYNIYYRDFDNDSYGNPFASFNACSMPIGYVSNSNDCQDNNFSIKPGAVEICTDGVDNNCNELIDGNDNNCAVVDTTPPVISSVMSNLMNNQSVNITWQTDENANGKIWYSSDILDLGNVIMNGNYLMNHSILINGLLNRTVYYYKIESCDSIGNCANSLVYSFIYNNAPVIILQSPLDGVSLNPNIAGFENRIVFEYSASDIYNVISCTLYVGVESRVNNEILYGHLITVGINLNNGDYSWNVSCVDEQGYVGESETRTFNVNYQEPVYTGSSGGGGGGGGSPIVPKPEVNKNEGSDLSTDDGTQRILLEEGEVGFAEIGVIDSVVLDLYDVLYEVRFEITDRGVLLKVPNGDYLIPRDDILPVLLGGQEIYVGVKRIDSDGAGIVLGLNRELISEQLAESAVGQKSNKVYIIFGIIIIILSALVLVGYILYRRYREINNKYNLKPAFSFGQKES